MVSYLSRTRLKRLLVTKAVHRYNQILRHRFGETDLPLPRIIHVETRSRCNGLCNFCMANIRDDPRKDQLMSDQLIGKVIHELAHLGYSNRLSFYNNNEPFLDNRLFDIIQKARIAIPLAYLEIKTNGRGINSQKVIELFNAGLDTLYVNDYDYTNEKGHRKNISTLKNDLERTRRFSGHLDETTGKYSKRLIISKRIVGEVLGSRAGTSPNKQPPITALNQSCCRPFEMMTISPEGVVGVCSEDFLYTSDMGNVNRQMIKEIWYSKRYREYRNILIDGGRGSLSPCNKCDNPGYTTEGLYEEGVLDFKTGLASSVAMFAKKLTGLGRYTNNGP